MISVFRSASERDVEKFATKLRHGLKSKFSFVIRQSKMLHLLAEVNGFQSWQSMRVRLGGQIPEDVLEYFLEETDTDPADILDVEDKDGVVYLAIREPESGEVSATVLWRTDIGWFREYWEGAEPFAQDCPIRILDLLSPTDHKGANRWREKCRIISSRTGFISEQDIPYHQLFYVGFSIKAGDVDVMHFVRETKDTFEGMDRNGNRAKFSIENIGNIGNINFTAIPEYRNNTWPIEEIVADPYSSKIRLVRLGGEKGVDVILEPGKRIISWCGYSSELRIYYGDHEEGGFFDQIDETIRNKK